jgi:hypothetical protein
MYRFLNRWLPRPVVIIVMVMWYLALLFMVFMYLTQPAGEFRYLNR